LNGYETLESRKIQVGYIVNQTIYNQYGQGDNMSGDKVGQDKIGRDKIR
jgi:hypothetical protein